MKKALTYFTLLIPIIIFGQYPFEKFKSPKYELLEFKAEENKNIYEYSCEVNSFFDNKENLQVLLHGNTENEKESYIELKSDQKSKKYFEEIFVEGADKLYVADFNGDNLKDIKVICLLYGLWISVFKR